MDPSPERKNLVKSKNKLDKDINTIIYFCPI